MQAEACREEGSGFRTACDMSESELRILRGGEALRGNIGDSADSAFQSGDSARDTVFAVERESGSDLSEMRDADPVRERGARSLFAEADRKSRMSAER